MNTIVTWQGVYPAMLTPFTAEDTLDLPLFQKNIIAQMKAGITGIIIGGSLGEASTLTPEEKLELLASALEITQGQIPVIVNIAEQATREAVARAKEAEANGADGLMLLPPMRYYSDARETVEYFKAVAQATSLPIMIYNNPVDYKIMTTIAMFQELSECPNIQAVKESTRDLTNIVRMRNAFGDRFKIMGGVDTLIMEAVVLGADGLVGGLVDAFPEETVALFNLTQQGQLAEALEIYKWFMPLLELDIHPKLVQNIKLAATATGIASEYVRAPRLPLIGEERAHVQAIIDKALATRPVLTPA
ncbi:MULTISPECIES: dihydrodipicolinate synthase family protein [unclassified Siphonobacter]|uniref:dihydrodipicolinate synthase family protein n=1 Tax=unclassified Siphonobacter TaxID=2635712 RepID=UPI000CA7EA96|nr:MULTISPECIES: dihydrodipicolinate synthase family protein [unclassified Siphonobacter]MDQ1090182.1 dihydrodipicolinate synthase/N-acetylneuraminate lyase [Siphonobacter sp. SORGH_AS_1065]MDR6197818.1 dihydrodipicolinate synthase/N-acetylneuraminate lyase [Siphonobacter sp. SORGH_AS_0500]PKK37274.1 dihydrodipicolinate synthase family protein [Siphonobacter sp. SORGH_AS_0500]